MYHACNFGATFTRDAQVAHLVAHLRSESPSPATSSGTAQCALDKTRALITEPQQGKY